MTPFCTIDIETIPSRSLPEGIKPEFNPDEVKIGGLGETKKQEKIALAKEGFAEALDKKMSLDPDLCQVVCFSVITPYNTWTYGHDQPCLIGDAWDVIAKTYFDHIPIVTFNGIGFDLPVLWHQAMILGIPVSAQMYSDLTKRYDNHFHYDLMEILSTWDKMKNKRNWKALDFYLKLFGIGDKIGESSEIYGWWQNQEYDKIKEHCENDVRMTAKLFERLFNWIVKAIP